MDNHIVDEDLVRLLRKQNTLLRKVNKHLRRALKDARNYADDLFVELCDKSDSDED
jgi:hypothetical protein